jgi:cleavage and polyadenylation specificity factor subunit 1
VDLKGPLPVAADGSCYFLTTVDRTTRWMEAAPLAKITAEACIAALTTTWFARFQD